VNAIDDATTFALREVLRSGIRHINEVKYDFETGEFTVIGYPCFPGFCWICARRQDEAVLRDAVRPFGIAPVR
jgi:hypothetical protein